jgi:hypothetical protein
MKGGDRPARCWFQAERYGWDWGGGRGPAP